jgi:membrane protein YdbS with pleckstrin-like domain
MYESSPSSESRLKRPKLVPYYRIAAILMVALVLVQAFLAGRGWFDDHDYFDTHEMVANLVFLNALVLLGLAIAIGAPAAWRITLIAPNVLLLVLVVAQISLGYSLTDGSAEAGAWHVPNGVLIFGLSVFLISLLPRLRAAAASGG